MQTAVAEWLEWTAPKLDGLPDEVRQPVQHFATWHHPRRIRAKAAAGDPTQGPVRSAKQDITEAVKFLVWLRDRVIPPRWVGILRRRMSDREHDSAALGGAAT